MRVMDSAMLVHQTCSVTNPFCPEANNGKWPDNSYVKSNVWNIDGFVENITSNAAGDGSALFIPAYNYQVVRSATVALDAVGYSTTATQLVAPPSNVNKWRMTSWGIKLSANTPVMTTQGVVQIRGFSPFTYGATLAMSKGTRFADFAEDIPLARLLNNDHFVIPMPMGDDAREWRSAADYSTTTIWSSAVNPGWQIINIGVSGAIASTNVCRVQLYYHYEFVFDENDSAIAYATPPPSDSPTVRAASAGVLERMGNVIEGTAKKVDAFFKSTTFKYVAAIGTAVMTKNPQAGLGILTVGTRGRDVD